MNIPTAIVHCFFGEVNRSNRNATCNNLYSSYPEVLQEKITMTGTLKKNKLELTIENLPRKNRVCHSSIFGFQNDATIASYMPPPQKKQICDFDFNNDFVLLKSQYNIYWQSSNYNILQLHCCTVHKMCKTFCM